MATDKMRVAFRADASYAIGTGHVMRCLTLADALQDRGADAAFVCREHEGNLCALIEDRGIRVHRLPGPCEDWAPSEELRSYATWVGADWSSDADETLSALDDFHPDWLIVDHYGLDARWENRVGSFARRVMVIDDLADRPHDCDMLLDQNLVACQDERYKRKLPERSTLLLGPTYALLQPDYARLRRRAVPREGPVRRLLVSFGGADKDGLTLKTVDALLKIARPEIEADIVLSAASPDFSAVMNRVAGRSRLRLHDRLPSLAPLMLTADLALGAGGATSWERLCLGLPTLVVTLADNQRPIAQELSRRGLVRWLGHVDTVSVAAIASALDELLAAGLDAAWSSQCFDVTDGLGVERVCAALTTQPDMPLSIRLAEPQDEALLLEWANDPGTRRNAFSPRAISLEEHQSWFRARLRRPDDCIFYIAETATGIPLGQVRFDRREGEWEISYSLAPVFRGLGLGRRMLDAAIEQLRRVQTHVLLVGQVKSENFASRRIFEGLGFSVRTSEPGRYVYTREFGE